MQNITMTLPLKFISAITLIALVSLTACRYDSEEDLFTPCVDVSNMSLSADIAPILNTNCFSCHASSQAQGGIDLENYNSLKTVAQNGRLSGAVNHLPGYSQMPPSGYKLTVCELQKIDAWIEQGALNN